MRQVLGAFDRRALEFEAMVRDGERRMPRDGALLERAAELHGHVR